MLNIKTFYFNPYRECTYVVSLDKKGDGDRHCLIIDPGMYGEREKLANAKEHRHMMIEEAAGLACEAKVKELWLTHYSPSLTHPEEYGEQVRQIFPGTVFGCDGMSTELGFEES